jgi:hypothetical protein
MCGVSVVVSFTFGVKVMGDTIRRPGLAAPGLMLLVAGISGIALNGQVAARRHKDEGVYCSSVDVLCSIWHGVDLVFFPLSTENYSGVFTHGQNRKGYYIVRR